MQTEGHFLDSEITHDIPRILGIFAEVLGPVSGLLTAKRRAWRGLDSDPTSAMLLRPGKVEVVEPIIVSAA